jgi:adenine-specific DNA-methyltransferase
MDVDKLGLDFPYCHPVSLYETLTGAATDSPDDIIFDFFAGSGTTAHAVMNLNRADGGSRKYILVEMGEHFNTVILPRIKKIAFSDKWKDGFAVLGNGSQGMSHFVKYYDLEQYEDTLRRAIYGDHAAPLFAATLDELAHYVFLRDLKLLDAVTVDVPGNRVAVALDRLYPVIDLAETLSCLTGKWIKRIGRETVEFADGSTADLAAPKWGDVKKLVWW